MEALSQQQMESFAVDGEVVAFEGALTSFSRLQQRMQVSDPEQARESGIAVFFYLFDILNLDGYAVTAIPLRQRKQLLRERCNSTIPCVFCLIATVTARRSCARPVTRAGRV
jgi:bifunctional non-homologous end joining protein LigD